MIRTFFNPIGAVRFIPLIVVITFSTASAQSAKPLFEEYEKLFASKSKNTIVQKKIEQLQSLTKEATWTDKTGKYSFDGWVVSVSKDALKVTLKNSTSSKDVPVKQLNDEGRNRVAGIVALQKELDKALKVPTKPPKLQVRNWANPRLVYESNLKKTVDFYELDSRIGQTVTILGSISAGPSRIDGECREPFSYDDEFYFRPVQSFGFETLKGRVPKKTRSVEDILKEKQRQRIGTQWITEKEKKFRGKNQNAQGGRRIYQYRPTLISRRVNPLYAQWSGTTATASEKLCKEVVSFLKQQEELYLPERQKWLYKLVLSNPDLKRTADFVTVHVELEAIARVTGTLELVDSFQTKPGLAGVYESRKKLGKRYPEIFDDTYAKTTGAVFKLPNLRVSEISVVALILRVSLLKTSKFDDLDFRLTDGMDVFIDRINDYDQDTDGFPRYALEDGQLEFVDYGNKHPTGIVTLRRVFR